MKLMIKILGLSLIGLPLVTTAQPTITLGNGVVNPAANLSTTALNPQQTAIADTVTLVPSATFSPLLQSILNGQMFTVGNNWNLVNNAVTLANNATFNLTTYSLFLNPGGNNQPGLPNGTAAGSAFGENISFTLNANPPQPNTPVGSSATLHWLQYVNTSPQNGAGFAVNGQQGNWFLDNGMVNGAAVSATVNGFGQNNGNNGPYYDSNNKAPPNNPFSVPLTFSDGPQFFAGVGNYVHFVAIPTWDIYTPAGVGTPATDSIDVANFGVAWGFSVVPEPSSMMLTALGLLAAACARACNRRGRNLSKKRL